MGGGHLKLQSWKSASYGMLAMEPQNALSPLPFCLLSKSSARLDRGVPQRSLYRDPWLAFPAFYIPKWFSVGADHGTVDG